MGNSHKCLHINDLRGRNNSPPYISLPVAGSTARVMLCQECHNTLNKNGTVLIKQYYNKPPRPVKRYPYASEPFWFEITII